MNAVEPDLRTSPRAIWQLTWPQLLMMYFLFFIGLTDVWTAGRINGDVQAALGMVTQGITFLQVIGIAVSTGAMAAISQSIGARRPQRARRYVALVIVCVAGLGIAMALPAGIFPEAALSVVMMPDEILPIGIPLWLVSMLTLPAHYIFGCSNVLFRATRQVLPPLWVGAGGCLMNLIGDLGFGLGYFGLPGFGYMGIIWTSFVCIWLCALGNCLLLTWGGYLNLKKFPCWRWIKKGGPYLIKVALNAGASQLVWQSGFLMLFIIVASLPSGSVPALAGLTAGLRIEALLFMPAIAINMSAAVLVGNSLGAGKKAEAKRLGIQLLLAGTGVMTVVAAVLWPFQNEIAALLSTEAEVQKQTVSYLTYNLLSTPFSVASTIMGGIMTGAGATKYNLQIYGSTFWLVRLPLAFFLGHFILRDASGVFCAMLISQILQSAIMLHVVLTRNWMRFAMKSHPDKENS